MAVYAIGDVQGCYDDLLRLLEHIKFDTTHDRLWFAGDLVNRGPQSLETLRLVRSLGESALCVLGNHELHLLAIANEATAPRPKDKFSAILAAPDSAELLEWLRYLPLLHHDPVLKFTLIHAGLPPQWDVALAQRCAREVEEVLRGVEYREFFHHMYGNHPELWSPALSGWERRRYITNCLTRLRYCDPDGHLALHEKGHPGQQPAPFLPWFAVPGRASRHERIIFGHWSTLGRYAENNVYGLDTGCVWGGALTALCLDDLTWHSVPCAGVCLPGED